MRESDLMTGPLEPTNSAYAMAKLTGLEMVRAAHKQHDLRAVCLMPPNLYGPNDNFGSDGHMVPMLIKRFVDAHIAGVPEVVVWGTGEPRREVMHVDDVAEACLYFMDHPTDHPEPLNIGTETDYGIRHIAAVIAETVGYKGAIRFDPSRPDGVPKKLMSSTEAYRLGWRPRISFVEGLRQTIEWYVEHHT